MKNGVPFLTATEEMSDAEAMAWSITFTEFEGQRFDWDNTCFIPSQS